MKILMSWNTINPGERFLLTELSTGVLTVYRELATVAYDLESLLPALHVERKEIAFFPDKLSAQREFDLRTGKDVNKFLSTPQPSESVASSIDWLKEAIAQA